LQALHLKRQYRIVMWSVISYDFDARVSPEQCLDNVMNHSFPGTIAVFHDSMKSVKNLLTVLPLYLEAMSKKGYTFKALEEQSL
jgi:hypothetical protein